MNCRSYCVLPTALLLACGPAGAQSDNPQAAEFARAVTEYAQGELQNWINDPFVLYAVEEQNETFAALTVEEIAEMDRKWRAEDGGGPMIYDMLDRQASILLRDRRALSGGVITEIILMDRYGLNAAMSDPTSDIYQGDEAKYQDTFLVSPDAIHVSELELDASTGKVQTQVSLTIASPETGVPIGAVTFGIDLSALTD